MNPFDTLFDETLNQLGAKSNKQPGDALLRQVRDLYGLKQVAYVCINLPTATNGSILFHGTYSDAWIRHYKSEQLALIDPVARAGLTSIVPFDWDMLRKRHPGARRVFAEAEEFGIGRRGLTFPVRGAQGELALFCVTADVSETEWVALRRILIRDLQVFATCFHNKVLQQQGHDTFKLAGGLSKKEITCLQYIASGLSLGATAERMRITERTIRFHLSNIRSKLDCLTTTQAVAKAITLGYVFPR